MALIETAVGVVVALFLTLLTGAMAYLALLSLREEVHSPRPSAEKDLEFASESPP